MIRIVLIIILAIAALPLNAQDLPYFKRVVKELSSARYRPEYDMYFVAFSGEDANLRGSTCFAEHPVVPLAQIKYLFNLDMIGDDNAFQYYHTPADNIKTVRWDSYEPIFKLVTGFIEKP